MPSISSLSLRIPVRYLTLIDLDLPMTTLVGIIENREEAPHLHTGYNKNKD
jgi:hypothetical protein